MIDPAEAAGAFDAAFQALAPTGLRVRRERDDDRAFLRALFLATSPLRGALPGPMLAQQADFQLAAYRHTYPDAMRRIVVGARAPVGRIVIDWGRPTTSHCVGLAVHPAYGGRGVATALLKSWIEVAAQRGLACTLTVAPDNPARALYARLGFREEPGEFETAGVSMSRPA